MLGLLGLLGAAGALGTAKSSGMFGGNGCCTPEWSVNEPHPVRCCGPSGINPIDDGGTGNASGGAIGFCCESCAKSGKVGGCGMCLDPDGNCSFQARQREPQTPQTPLQQSISLSGACCDECARTGGSCQDTPNTRTLGVGRREKPPIARPGHRPPPNKILHLPGVGAATTTTTTTPTGSTTTTTPSNTTTYVVVGGAALALGVLGAILYKRRSHAT